MPQTAATPLVIFPEWFDERAEYEVAMKGWLDQVRVQVPDGSRYAVFFLDPTRLQQDLAEHEKLGQPYLAEPGLIILAEITPTAIRTAVEGLWRQGYFAHLQPLGDERNSHRPGKPG
jgi:hypothetical protein